jgi:hypothetical protein
MVQSNDDGLANDLDWSLVCYAGTEEIGEVAVIHHDGKSGKTSVKTLDVESQSGTSPLVFLNLTNDHQAALLDPATKKITQQKKFPAHARPDHMYRYPDQAQLWLGNDGDKSTGADPGNCGTGGSSVTVIQSDTEGAPMKVLRTLCVGRGHHVVAFTYPTPTAPNIPRRAFVSNLMSGDISVVGNDPEDAATYLKVLATIDLQDTAREKKVDAGFANGAAPHGMAYSELTGKVYNLNNGYGTVVVMDPLTNTIEDSIYVGLSSNALLSPNGRFIICKGADRATQPEHVIGKLTVLDVVSKTVFETIDLPDIYPSVYRFSRDGSKLYLTTAATGKGSQRSNLKKDVLLVFDASTLVASGILNPSLRSPATLVHPCTSPALRLIKEIKVGIAECGRRPIGFVEQDGKFARIFISNPTDGTVTVLNGQDERVLETVKITDKPVPALHFYTEEWRLFGA